MAALRNNSNSENDLFWDLRRKPAVIFSKFFCDFMNHIVLGKIQVKKILNISQVDFLNTYTFVTFLTAHNKLADIQNPMIIKLTIFDTPVYSMKRSFWSTLT